MVAAYANVTPRQPPDVSNVIPAALSRLLLCLVIIASTYALLYQIVLLLPSCHLLRAPSGVVKLLGRHRAKMGGQPSKPVAGTKFRVIGAGM